MAGSSGISGLRLPRNRAFGFVPVATGRTSVYWDCDLARLKSRPFLNRSEIAGWHTMTMNLYGLTVEFGVGDPWELGEELRDQPMVGELVQLDDDEHPRQGLFKLKNPVRYAGKEWTYIAATIRHQGHDFNELKVCDCVHCNCTGLDDESASNPEKMFGQKWRGGGLAFIGTLIRNS